MEPSNFLTQGGPVMYVLLGASVLAAAIILAKLYQFSRYGLRRTQGCVDDSVAMVQNGKYDDALERLSGCSHPVARVLESALRGMVNKNVPWSVVDVEIGRVGTQEIRRLESWLRPLSSIAHLSPLLGLLGTVFGMIEAFRQISLGGPRIDPTQLSGGIWEALLTTAFGLAVAIPTMAAFYYLEGEVDRVRALMKDKCLQLMVHFGQVPGEGDPVSETTLVRDSYGV